MKKLLSLVLFFVMSAYATAGQFSIMAENDVTAKTDEYFTHGTRLQYVEDSSFGYSIGQNMYTPTDLRTKELIPNDRPYAGYLYGSAFDTIYLENGDDVFAELQLGTTGPNSLAEDTQKLIHTWIGSTIPQGWDNQIPNHFTFLLIDRYTSHIYESQYFAIDPFVGSQLGNLADYVSGGFNVYAGYNLPKDRNQHRVIPFKDVQKEGWNPYGYVYCGIEPKIMMYNMLLEDHRYTIHPNSSVYDRNLGIVLGCRYFELAFTFCLRSKEFEEQDIPERFGAAKISANF